MYLIQRWAHENFLKISQVVLNIYSKFIEKNVSIDKYSYK